MKLEDDEKEMLEKVLSIADHASMIRHAITEVIRGVHEDARRVYLRNLLSRAAAKRLREINKKKVSAAARKKAKVAIEQARVVSSPAMYLDAYRHELAMAAPND